MMASLREESDLTLCLTMKIWPHRKKKRRGRKVQWQDRHVVDMVDVICSNDNFARKLIFTMATGSVANGTQPPPLPSFNNFLQNKMKSLN